MAPHASHPVNERPQPRRDRVFAAVLVAVMAAGAWQAIAAWRNPASLEDLVPGSEAWTDGRNTRALEKGMDAHLPARDGLVAFANGLRYRLLRGGGSDVAVGRAGWLYLTEELRHDPAAAGAQDVRLDLLTEASRRLDSRGVRLVIALVPDKARVHPDFLPGGHYPHHHDGRYRGALLELRSRGVEVVDLLGPLRRVANEGPAFYRTDTHWNQAGAVAAARAIAASIWRNGGCTPTTRYRTTLASRPEPRAGDLVRMMGLEHAPALLRPRPDSEAPATTDRIAATAPEADMDAGLGLFDDASVPVVLTGTSFSLRGNFHGALQEALSCEVLNSAQDGGGLLQATGQYLSDDAYRQSPPAYIIWEVPERFLTLPLGEETGWLQQTGLAE